MDNLYFLEDLYAQLDDKILINFHLFLFDQIIESLTEFGHHHEIPHLCILIFLASMIFHVVIFFFYFQNSIDMESK